MVNMLEYFLCYAVSFFSGMLTSFILIIVLSKRTAKKRTTRAQRVRAALKEGTTRSHSYN